MYDVMYDVQYDVMYDVEYDVMYDVHYDVMSVSGEVSPRQLESLSGDSNFSQWNLSHWIRLLQKPPVWYRF